MKSLIEERPPRPQISEIIADLESASIDDVVFGKPRDNSEQLEEKSSATTVATDDSVNGDEAADNADIISQDSDIFGGQESLEVNANYSKVLTFLELYTSLKDCPPELHQQVMELQSLSSEVTRSIAVLKEKSDSLPTY